MKTICSACIGVFILAGVIKGFSQDNAPQLPAADSIGYLGNGIIRIGVDLDLGGSITYLAPAEGENMINDFDWGRQIQMSFYSGPVPFMPHGKKPLKAWEPLGWNPIQSGDCFRNRAKVIAYQNDGNEIYVKSIPMQWPLDNVPGECTFECWISLHGSTVSVRSRIHNHREDTTQYSGRTQELPAVYTNGNYHNLVTYKGARPYSGDSVTYVRNENPVTSPSIRWAHWEATENWAASLNDKGWGLGIWCPGVQGISGGFYGDKHSARVGSKDPATCYIAPNHREILDHNISYQYEYTLIVGTLKQIRSYVYRHAKQKDALPSYRFDHDRQHWVYENTRDAGWPITGEISVRLQKGAALLGPSCLWLAGKAPYLYIDAAYHTKAPKGRVYWKTFEGKGYDDARSVQFDIVGDGAFHTYRIPLKNAALYKGSLTGLKIVPAVAGAKNGDRVEIRSIRLGK
jgi:hypothetical protein